MAGGARVRQPRRRGRVALKTRNRSPRLPRWDLWLAIIHRAWLARAEATLTARPAGVNAVPRDPLRSNAARRARPGCKCALSCGRDAARCESRAEVFWPSLRGFSPGVGGDGGHPLGAAQRPGLGHSAAVAPVAGPERPFPARDGTDLARSNRRSHEGGARDGAHSGSRRDPEAPQIGFSHAIRTMSLRTSTVTLGRPGEREIDVQ